MPQTAAFKALSATAPDSADPSRRPSRLLQDVILNLLTPLFRPACNGDTTLARWTAQGALDAHNPRTVPELLAVAQVIAFRQSDLAIAKAKAKARA